MNKKYLTKSVVDDLWWMYEYFPYHPLVLRDGDIHPISEADLNHPEWGVTICLVV